MRRRRAFSLLEAMLTLLIVFLVFGVASQLLSGYASLVKSSASKSDTLTSLQVGMQQMLDDVRQATSITSPSGGPSTDLLFTKVNPGANWLSTPPTPWSPPANLVQVHYTLSGTTLMRAVSSDLLPVCDGVAGLQLSDQTNGIQIQLTLREPRRILVVTGFAGRPQL